MNLSPSKILIIGPAWVGDMVMAQTLFKLLKQRHPQCTIDVLAPPWTVSLLNVMTEVTQSIPMPIGHGKLELSTRYHIAKKLREYSYDHAIVLPNSFKSALIPWLAKIPKRTGWLGEFRHFVLNDIRHLDKKRYPLMIEQFMALGLAPHENLPSVYPYPSFNISKAEQEQTLAKHQPLYRDRPILGIAAGAEFGPSKRWPPHYYAEVANQKLAEGWDVWLFGSAKDKKVTDEIMDLTEQRCENLAGRCELRESIHLLSLVTGVITNDSGLMHIAAALAKPLIAIYGSTSPSFTPPLSNDAKILKLDLACQPCFSRTCPLKHHHCMQNLMAEKVLHAITAWPL